MIAVPALDGQRWAAVDVRKYFLAKFESSFIFFALLSLADPKFSRGILNGYESHLMPIVHCTVVEENC